MKQGFSTIGLFTLGNIVGSCKANSGIAESSTGDESSTTANNDCIVSSDETAGPFPTKKPQDLLISDIASDRQGTPLLVKINVLNAKNDCKPLEGALVDIWHCDANGYYSEYGGTGMQSVNMTSVHFLRGRQVSNNKGIVSFNSIYPGWYRGRAPHIHVHIFDKSGKSLKISQIAFPESVSKTIYSQGAYAANGQADTSNLRDSIFRDGISTNMSVITGDFSKGYELVWNAVVES